MNKETAPLLLDELSQYTVQMKIKGEWQTHYVEALDKWDALDQEETVDLLPLLEAAPLIRLTAYQEWDCNGLLNGGGCKHN